MLGTPTAKRPRILTTVGEVDWPETDSVQLGFARRGRVAGLLQVARRARTYDVVLLNGAVSFARWYDEIVVAGWLARVVPGLCVVLEGCYWEEGTRVLDRMAWRFSGRPLGFDPPACRGRRLARALVSWVTRPSVYYVVFGTDERAVFARRWSIPQQRVVAITYHSHRWAESANVERAAGEPLVFAGGNSLRDYRPLLAAAERIPASILVATSLPTPPGPANLRVGALGEAEFRAAAAAATVHVVPMIADPPRSAGQASYLDALMLGASLVVTDGLGVRDHVSHEREALIVPPDDVEALAAGITRCLEDAGLRRGLAAAGRARARSEFTLEAFRAREYACLVEVWQAHQRSAGWADAQTDGNSGSG